MSAFRCDAKEILSRMFAEVFPAYLECSHEVQVAIRGMVAIVNHPETTAEETEAALLTIADGLFPSPAVDLADPLGGDV